jgi:hypothetical protein
MIDPRQIDAIDFDVRGRVLRAYCLAHSPRPVLHLLTGEQRHALEQGIEVVIITATGQRTDLRPAFRTPANQGDFQ